MDIKNKSNSCNKPTENKILRYMLGAFLPLIIVLGYLSPILVGLYVFSNYYKFF